MYKIEIGDKHLKFKYEDQAQLVQDTLEKLEVEAVMLDYDVLISEEQAYVNFAIHDRYNDFLMSCRFYHNGNYHYSDIILFYYSSESLTSTSTRRKSLRKIMKKMEHIMRFAEGIIHD